MDAIAKQINYYTIEDIYNLPNGQILNMIHLNNILFQIK